MLTLTLGFFLALATVAAFLSATSFLFAAACALPFSLIPNDPAGRLEPEGIPVALDKYFPLFMAAWSLPSWLIPNDPAGTDRWVGA